MKSYSILNRSWDIVAALQLITQSGRGLLKDRALANLSDPKWYNPSSRSSLHDSWIIDVYCTFRSLEAPKQRKQSILIRVLGAYHDRIVIMKYEDVSRARNLEVDVISQSQELLAHEFEVSDESIVHRLLLANGVEMEIIASDIEICEEEI